MGGSGLPSGSGREVGQLPSVVCTYSDCSKRFDNEKDMKRHKKNDPEHFYCKKCDQDCMDWESLTQHKVEMMAPFLDNRNKLIEKGELPQHITCEFCGEDFKSFGGRRQHREQVHPADQSIECPAREQGCSHIFFKAAALIMHLEDGRCQFISRLDFKAAVTQKYVAKELFAVGHFSQTLWDKLAEYKAYRQDEEEHEVITDGAEYEDQEEGGVRLDILDDDDAAQRAGQEPLDPDSNLIDLDAQLSRTRVISGNFPSLPAQGSSQLERGLRAMSMSTAGSDNGCSSSVTSRRGGNKVWTESYPSLASRSTSGSTIAWDNEDTASEATTCATGQTATLRRLNRTETPKAWTTGNTSKALFDVPKPNLKPGHWSAIAREADNDALASEKRNLLHCRFYDPNSPDYDPDVFFHTLYEKYCCPFPQCDDQQFDCPSDIAEHLLSAHMKTDFRCTTCMKRFKAAAPLVAHIESAGKCQVQQSNNYKKLLDDITGGFLTAKLVPVPKIFKMKDALVEYGRPLDGVTGVLFNSKMPNANVH